jgi:pSer/pThr/pTyr-binding forkhead associated (FHA) protein
VIAGDKWSTSEESCGGTVLGLGKHTVGRLLAINPVDARSREFILREPQTSIGKDESNDVVVRDPTVSKKHAIVKRRKRRWELVDAKSSNGTFVGDTRITDKPASLADGQEIRFGGAKFVFRETSPAEAEPDAPRESTPRRKSAFSFRTASAFVILAFVIGFAVMQYVSYVNYKRANENALSSGKGGGASMPSKSTAPASHSP